MSLLFITIVVLSSSFSFQRTQRKIPLIFWGKSIGLADSTMMSLGLLQYNSAEHPKTNRATTRIYDDDDDTDNDDVDVYIPLECSVITRFIPSGIWVYRILWRLPGEPQP